MRIAFISPFFPLKGGIARFSGLLADAFREQRGDDVVPLAFRALFPNFITKGAEAPLPEKVRLVLFNPFSWLETVRCIRSLKPDIVLVAYWTGLLAPLCFVVRRFTGIKMVVLLHNLSSHESFFIEPLMQRLLAASADGVLTLSGAVSQEVKAAMPKIPLLKLFHPVYEPEGSQPLVVDARKALNLDIHSPVLLFFGYVRHYKGLDVMLRAMPAILRREPALRLVVAGHFYEDVSLYRQLVDQLGLAGNVDLYPGYVSAERSALYFASADAVVLPYRSATQSGVVQLAYGYGLPVIVTPEGALPEMVRPGETGWVARDSSFEGFAEAVLQFLDNRERLPLMRPAIEVFRHEYSWEAFADSAGSFLETIAAGR
ncbi:MAG: glycosyltransferase family 4 protein [Chlorobiaceae bacterium]